jgi:hypothetical protein
MSPKTFEEILSPIPTTQTQPTHTKPTRTAVEGQPPSSMPFQTALQRLATTLAEALAFFNHLEHSFTRATDPISAHVGSEVLDRIWASRVAGARDEGGYFYLGGHGDMDMDMDMDMDTGYTCMSWMQKLRTRIVAFFTNKPKFKPRLKPTAITIPPSTFHDHLTRLQKDLHEALTARWPRGAKHDGLRNPNILADEQLLSLCCVYDRVSGLVGVLRGESRFDVLASVHSRFLGVLRQMELLQIGLGQSVMFWG